MRFIGDVHAKFDRYLKLIEDVPASIQVGDFGAGFKPIPARLLMDQNHRFIRGNHDNPEVCKEHPAWIKDGHFEDDMFFCGGGLSIDQDRRTEGVDWWRDEELSTSEFYSIMDIFEEKKPRVMVSHEVPISISRKLFNVPMVRNGSGSRTSQCLDSMFYIHKPEIWICGHWHQRRDQIIDGTRFIVLEELGIIDL